MKARRRLRPLGVLHDTLDEAGHRKLERFLVPLLFCLFADDAGIFQPLGIFEEFLKDRTRENSADLGPMLSELFEVLDTPGPERGKQLDADLARFDYINGELFLAAEKKAGARHAKTANACRF